ncbi:MAG: hypothetical protein ACK5QW_09505 [Cyanobacteriota bacterium]
MSHPPSKLSRWSLVIALALALPLASPPRPANANTDPSSVNSLRASVESGLVWELLAGLFQPAPPDRLDTRTPDATDQPPTTAGDSGGWQTTVHQDGEAEFLHSPGPVGRQLPIARVSVEEGAPTQPAAAAVRDEPPPLESPNDGSDSIRFNEEKVTGDDTFGGSPTIATYNNGWQSLQVDSKPNALPNQQAGNVASSPGPLPTAAALAGWDAARRLRRRCRPGSKRGDRGDQGTKR